MGNLNFYYVPVIMVAIASYFVADVVLEVYEMAVDTIFLCFVKDLDVNDGSKEKPYFMTKGLQRIVEKYNEGSIHSKKDSEDQEVKASKLPKDDEKKPHKQKEKKKPHSKKKRHS